MIETKTRYAQIENGALATTWASDASLITFWENKLISKWSQIIGSSFWHKTPRSAFRLFLMQFAFSVSHVSGKLLYTATLYLNCQNAWLKVNNWQNSLKIKWLLPLSVNFPPLQAFYKPINKLKKKTQCAHNSLHFAKWNGQTKILLQQLSKYWSARHCLTILIGLLLLKHELWYQNRFSMTPCVKVTKLIKV